MRQKIESQILLDFGLWILDCPHDPPSRSYLFEAFQSASAVRQAQAPSLVEGMRGHGSTKLTALSLSKGSSEETGGVYDDIR